MTDRFVVDRRTNSKGPDWREGGAMVPTVPVPLDRPAPTLTGKAGGQWVFREAQANGARRTMDAPAMTITASADNGIFAWVYERPATTVCGDPRLSPPGFRGRPEDYEEDGTYTGERSMDKAIKLTLAEGLILQSFPPDYPVQGNKGKQWEQVGNAVPPLLAAHVIAALTGASAPAQEAA